MGGIITAVLLALLAITPGYAFAADEVFECVHKATGEVRIVVSPDRCQSWENQVMPGKPARGLDSPTTSPAPPGIAVSPGLHEEPVLPGIEGRKSDPAMQPSHGIPVQQPLPAPPSSASQISILAAVLALVAIALAVTAVAVVFLFYKATQKIAEEIVTASNTLAVNTERLEKVSDRYMLSVFLIMKDVLLHRAQAKPAPPATPCAESRPQPGPFPKASPGRSPEGFQEDAETVVTHIVMRPGITTLRDLSFILRGRFAEEHITETLFKLRADGRITWEGNETQIDFATPIVSTYSE